MQDRISKYKVKNKGSAKKVSMRKRDIRRDTNQNFIQRKQMYHKKD